MARVERFLGKALHRKEAFQVHTQNSITGIAPIEIVCFLNTQLQLHHAPQ